MENTIEEVIEMRPIKDDKDNTKIDFIINEIITMIFEIIVSFIPIILYYTYFFISNKNIDYFEHIKNGSIVWIFLALLVMGNFKILFSSEYSDNIWQKIIFAWIIIFILFLLGLYLILNFSTYGIIEIKLEKFETTILVISLGITTIALNIFRIILF